jgi:hypothetical protein
MHYMRLDAGQREEFLDTLARMPEFLRSIFNGLSAEQARSPALDGGPSPVEQVWHLADLEREGYGVRIQRLLTETEPHLPDFDGAQVAAARNYRSRSLDDGLAAFADARGRNISTLRSLDAQSWVRSGSQDGVGPVSLCDIPSFMSQHDSAHRAEIEVWKNSFRG